MLRYTILSGGFLTSRTRGGHRCGFTLVELLVVIGIIGLLVSIMLPVVGRVRRQAQVTLCMSNLREVGKALQLYANDHNGCIPLLSETMPFPVEPQRSMNYTAHNFIWFAHPTLPSGLDVGPGLLLERGYLAAARSLYCPADEVLDAEAEIEKLGRNPPIATWARTSYVSRYLFELSQPGGAKLHNLGNNRIGQKARMVMADPMVYGPGSQFHHQAHGGRSVNVLYVGGHVKTVLNQNGMLEVRLPELPEYPDETEGFWAWVAMVVRRADWYDETGRLANPPSINDIAAIHRQPN
jgi:prepilin-type N-terminal cleavage/methylation domain-containing protein/prepilin-type processing-associated H-X9-DG protein